MYKLVVKSDTDETEGIISGFFIHKETNDIYYLDFENDMAIFITGESKIAKSLSIFDQIDIESILNYKPFVGTLTFKSNIR